MWISPNRWVIMIRVDRKYSFPSKGWEKISLYPIKTKTKKLWIEFLWPYNINISQSIQNISRSSFSDRLHIAFLHQQIQQNVTFLRFKNVRVTKRTIQMISFQETRTLIILRPPAALQLCGNRSGGSADAFGCARQRSVRIGYPGRQCGAADNSTTSSRDSSFTAGFCLPLSVFRLPSSSHFEFCG